MLSKLLCHKIELKVLFFNFYFGYMAFSYVYIRICTHIILFFFQGTVHNNEHVEVNMPELDQGYFPSAVPVRSE